MRKQVFDTRAITEFDGLLRRATQLFETAKIKNFDKHTGSKPFYLN